ncbi:MAG: hypothetical protein AAFM92_03335 [Pseudomonadota bacterium]
MLDPYDGEAIRKSARNAFGHVPGIDTEECLARLVSHLRNGMNERNAAWRENQELREQVQSLQAALLAQNEEGG